MTSAPPSLADIDLSDTDFWARPPAERDAAFAVLRGEESLPFYAEPIVPFIPPGPGYYAVTRHADIETISSRPALFCSGRGAVSIPDLPAELNEFYGSMISMDDPRHGKIRRIVSRAFTPKLLERLVGRVEALATDLVTSARQRAEAGDGTFELVGAISAPLPLMVICDMMGVPPEDRDLVLHNTNIVLSGGDPDYVADENEAVRIALEAGGALAELMTRLVGERAARPTDDLTSALVAAEVDGQRLTHQEIASFFILLCVAGNETTRTAISQGVLALSQFPAQRALWRSDEALTKTAVEEIVRWASPVTWMRRTATRDVEVGGRQYREGDKFVLYYNSANRDDAVFANPNEFDVARNPNPHLGFGARGPHFCLGSNLARREIAVVFRALFEQLPDLQVLGEPDYLRSSFINGIKSLPVGLRG